MTESIILGTYIDGRAEGLLTAEGVSTGGLPVVATASAGPVLRPTTLAMPGQARLQYGAPDDPGDPEDGEDAKPLVRAIELCYGSGASTVVGVRVAVSSAANASLAIRDAGAPVAELTAVSPRTWADAVQALVGPATEDCLIEGEQVPAPFDELAFTPVLESPRSRLRHAWRERAVRGFRLVYRRLKTSEPVDASGANPFFRMGHLAEAGVPAASVRVSSRGGSTTDYAGGSSDYGLSKEVSDDQCA